MSLFYIMSKSKNNSAMKVQVSKDYEEDIQILLDAAVRLRLNKLEIAELSEVVSTSLARQIVLHIQ